MRTLNQEGIRTFGRGYVPTVFGIFPYAGLDLLIAESIKFQLENNVGWATNNDGNLHGILPFLIGGTSSMVAGPMAYPVNLIRTKASFSDI